MTVKTTTTASKTAQSASRAANKRSPTSKKAAPVKAVHSVSVRKATIKKEPAPSVTKEKKVKVVRDSFTIPKNEFSQLAEMKKKALALGLEIKKSELIRAGLMLLASANDAGFKKALAAVPTLKTGRPGKG